MATSIRKLMGIGSYTTSGRGTTSYCMSDGREECTDQDYKTVNENLVEKLGEAQYVDPYGCQYWFVKGTGLIFLPANSDAPYKYVECDKNCTEEYWENFKSKI